MNQTQVMNAAGTSHLTPHTSHLTPHTSHLTPHTSHCTPRHRTPFSLASLRSSSAFFTMFIPRARPPQRSQSGEKSRLPPLTIITIFLFHKLQKKRALAAAVVALDRNTLKAKIMNSPEVMVVMREAPIICAHLFRQHSSDEFRMWPCFNALHCNA